MSKTSYAIGLGANRYCNGPPAISIARALGALEENGAELVAASAVVETPALGPGTRNFANAAAVIESDLLPPAMLSLCKQIEKQFGRRPGRRWGDRPLDLDILLWSNGVWAENTLTIPHPEFRKRPFALAPLAQIVPDWKDPITGLSIRHLHHRLNRPNPVDPNGQHP